MDARDVADVSLTFAVRCAVVAIMYFVIFKYRLPYLQVLLAYAGLEALSRVYDNTIHHAIVSSSPASRRVHRSFNIPAAVLLLGTMVFVSLLAVPAISLYRFSALEAGGLFLTGFISGNVVNSLFAAAR